MLSLTQLHQSIHVDYEERMQRIDQAHYETSSQFKGYTSTEADKFYWNTLDKPGIHLNYMHVN